MMFRVKKHVLFFALCFIMAASAAAFAFLPVREAFVQIVFKQGSVLEARARDVLNTCEGAKYRPACYDQEIPNRTVDLSLADSFAVTKIVQRQDQNYWYCHVLGHKLSARETAKDPSKWEDVVAQCPSGMCSNGCIHGAFQERYRTEALAPPEAYALVPELREVCEERANWHPTGLEQATCYHALGHLAMYITGAEIHTAVDICRQVAVKSDGRDFTQVCFDGAFMQIFQPLEPEDIALVEGKNPGREGLYNFCKNFNGNARAACWGEGWPLFGEEIKTPQGLMKFCSTFSGAVEQNRCFSGMFYVLMAQFNLDEKKIVPFCGGISDARRGECFSQAASRLIETDYGLIEKAVGICNAAEQAGVGEECYQSLIGFSKFDFKRESAEALKFCEKLPDKWALICKSVR